MLQYVTLRKTIFSLRSDVDLCYFFCFCFFFPKEDVVQGHIKGRYIYTWDYYPFLPNQAIFFLMSYMVIWLLLTPFALLYDCIGRYHALSWTLNVSHKSQKEEEQPLNPVSFSMLWKWSFTCLLLGANSSCCSWIMFIWKRSMKIKAARGDSKEHMMETNWVTTNVANIVGGNWDTRMSHCSLYLIWFM